MAVLKLKAAKDSQSIALSMITDVVNHDGRIFVGANKENRKEVNQSQATQAILAAILTPSDDTIYFTPKPKPQPKSRGDRWSEAASKATDGVQEMVEIQEEFKEWLENLGDKFEGSALKEKLEEITSIDLESALDTISEAEGADLPQGFGRD